MYRDKSYPVEAKYVMALLRRYAPDARRVLDLGCGTGAHARELAESGYSIHGVDLSAGMLDSADKMRAALPSDIAERLTFSQGDVRALHLNEKFDAIISLFHVMSYQTSNQDLAGAFESACSNLAPGGVFIFDCWYGPAVLTDRPRSAKKIYAEGGLVLQRVAEPVMDPERNLVQVNYTLEVTEASASPQVIRETHTMRYLFSPEVEFMLEASGLTLVDSREWLSDRLPGFDSWNACYVARK